MLTLTNKKQLGVLSSSFKANGCFLWALDTPKFGVCRVNHKSLLLKAPAGGGGGGTPHIKGVGMLVGNYELS